MICQEHKSVLFKIFTIFFVDKEVLSRARLTACMNVQYCKRSISFLPVIKSNRYPQ